MIKTLSVLPGCFDHEHRTWFIGPVGHHRDSDPVEESNWQVMLDEYQKHDPDYKNHEVHRFGHWAVGWIEEVAVKPGSSLEPIMTKLRNRLEQYPILDEFHLSALEEERKQEGDCE